MKNSIFSYSFSKKPDPVQWNVLKKNLPSQYSLPDTDLLANLHRSRVPLSTLPVHEWLKDNEITRKEEEELAKQFKHLLPRDYVIPDPVRLKNIFIK